MLVCYTYEYLYNEKLSYCREQHVRTEQNSASAAHVYLGWLTDRATHTEHSRIAYVVQLGYSQIV